LPDDLTAIAAPNDLSALWMPFTNNRVFKREPKLFVGAKDMHYVTPDGRQVLDAVAGLWCVNAGHARPKIVAAIQRQAAQLDYAPSFQLGHPLAFELALKLRGQILPAGLEQVFFSNSGSEAVDTALKIALAYQRARGQGQRTRLVGRERGYHGVGFGGISVGGMGPNRRAYGPLLPGADHLRHTYDPAQRFTRGQPERGAELADDLERMAYLHGDTIAAVIVEPVAGSTGVLPPPKGYLERLRAICDTHGALLVFDEVITAFGRLGTATAAERFGVTPDIMTMAKGITNAAVPMGATAVTAEVYDTVVENAAPGIELFHGYTYSGHPLACAAALATLETYAEEGLFARAAGLEAGWEDAAHSLKGAPNVIDIRNLGLTAAVELAPRDGAPGARAAEVFRRCFDDDLLVRVTADTIALSPPLIISEGQIAETMEKLGKAIAATA
jgi:beta-alanine--pyruvate transaminase